MTKRQLGLSFVVLGATVIIALFAADLVGAARFQGVGPTQRLALLAAGVLFLVGLSLIPLGDKPA
jgi:hypothetical protein